MARQLRSIVPARYVAAVGVTQPRLIRALNAQLEARHDALAAGAGRVGWKLGIGERERIGDGPVIGHLTTASCIESGGVYRGSRDASLHADAELALEFGASRVIVGCGAALEIVDLGGSDDPEEIVAGNVFHRAVAFGPMHPVATNVQGALVVNGQVRATGSAAADLTDMVRRAAKLLHAIDEGFMPGDRLITGSIVQVPVAAGDVIAADLGNLGSAELTISQ
jgi:2-keto-4-pentenoate hydratase